MKQNGGERASSGSVEKGGVQNGFGNKAAKVNGKLSRTKPHLCQRVTIDKKQWYVPNCSRCCQRHACPKCTHAPGERIQRIAAPAEFFGYRAEYQYK